MGIKIEFGDPSDVPEHECDVKREGDWMVFTCPKCPEYERRINGRTHEMSVKKSYALVNHSGTYDPFVHPADLESLN